MSQAKRPFPSIRAISRPISTSPFSEDVSGETPIFDIKRLKTKLSRFHFLEDVSGETAIRLKSLGQPPPLHSSLLGLRPLLNVTHSYLALSVTWVSMGTERAVSGTITQGLMAPFALGSLSVTSFFVALRSWEPWRSEPFTAPFALGSLGVKSFFAAPLALGGPKIKAVYVIDS